ncbi:MAG: D-methionine transport system permease protein [Thermoanaerobacterium sp.]|uniref:D-methionine transport system permease protein n=1 Tax=Thermoanaerobacterium butyriciformans TaxID=1702242 RepID=A0ABS4NBV4_9THEO|nr:methionine ABC transporter permease [Thermoanaerobacterium butyriciformans]MDI3477539.1 D-methionine transport system permease protein [Thermoanaerobacterium sp.]WHE06613.1 ABC transporter permease [Thermoanaerobacterium thermosaccharolyticum]MBP2071157.1 D-methionine transport system permease protein [Thermoanaerobacterium butyriciformans]MDK2805302.1 D-methionine transport system permease protein [Thermoanaerobacterium sp.]MDN5317166.1 D-methionine transport system permease protein [Therm
MVSSSNTIQYLINLWQLMEQPLWESLYMVFFSTLFSVLIGLPLGIILVITDKGHLSENIKLNHILGTIINIMRSVPFIILIIAIFPLSRLIVGTTIGPTAAIVALSVAAAPFVARVIESSLKEVDWGVIEASISVGATIPQIIFKVMIPESLPSLILGVTLTIINILGYSAMAGAIGGGGLGDLAIRYGYQRYETDVLIATIIVLIVFVEIVQRLGNYLAKKVDKR